MIDVGPQSQKTSKGGAWRLWLKRIAITLGVFVFMIILAANIDRAAPKLGSWLMVLVSAGGLIWSLRHRQWSWWGYAPNGWRWLLGILTGLFLLSATAPKTIPRPPKPNVTANRVGTPTVQPNRPKPPAVGPIPAPASPRPSPSPSPSPRPSPTGSPTPAKRPVIFSAFQPGEPLHSAQDALNAGDTTRAAQLYFARDRSRDDARTGQFRVVLERIWNRQKGNDPSADFVFRIGAYWNADIDRLPLTPPNSEEQWNKIMPSIEVLGQSAAEGERLKFSQPHRAIVSSFVQRLSARQAKTLPMVRRHIAERLRANWFRLNIEVKATGPGARTLQLTGPMFANNANIEDVQKDIDQVLTQARFRRVEYRWSRYSGARFYAYRLDAPADTQIAYWDGAGGFHIVNLR